MARVTFNTGPYLAKVRSGLERTLSEVGARGEYHAKTEALNQPGKGSTYPRGKSKQHRASLPGDPPAPDTGRLRASVTHEVLAAPDAVTARTSVNAEYALPLEEGTEKIAPRPFRARILRAMQAAFPGAARRHL